MGELFSQMVSLVSAQNEVVARIEDDVEEGLVNSKVAHTHIENVYSLTKANRGMIVKIFALLLFFILLFVVWT
jgi:syntaxin 5